MSIPAPDHRAVARLAMLDRFASEGRTEWVDAHGGSMRPLIHAGDRLLVAFGRRPEGIGEVVLVRDGNRVVAHRLVARGTRAEPARIVTKGDAEVFPDRVADDANVLGTVVAVTRASGRTFALRPGRMARATARISWWTGRLARAGRKVARRMPRPVRPLATFLVHDVSRIPVRVATAPMTWATRIHVRKEVIRT